MSRMIALMHCRHATKYCRPFASLWRDLLQDDAIQRVSLHYFEHGIEVELLVKLADLPPELPGKLEHWMHCPTWPDCASPPQHPVQHPPASATAILSKDSGSSFVYRKSLAAALLLDQLVGGFDILGFSVASSIISSGRPFATSLSG